MKVKLTLETDPKSISLEEAAEKTGRSKNQLHSYLKPKSTILDYGQIKGVKGKRIILNEKWDAFLKQIKIQKKQGRTRASIKSKPKI